MLRELIDQCAFSGTRSAGHSNRASMSAVWKKSLEQLKPSRRMILNRRDGTSEGSRVARAKLLYPWLDWEIQTSKCKAETRAAGTQAPGSGGSVWNPEYLVHTGDTVLQALRFSIHQERLIETLC